MDSGILTGLLLDLGIPTIFKSNWILKKIQVITYRLTNINYIVPGCHHRSSGVVMGRRAAGGCWRWAVVEDGGGWWAVFTVSGVGCTVWVVLGCPHHW